MATAIISFADKLVRVGNRGMAAKPKTSAGSTVSSPSKGSRKTNAQNSAEPIAPDGGWGWVILAASFCTSIIVDGVCFAFGIFYIEFLQYFKENRGKTAWIGSVLNGTYMIMGPIAGALCNKFGCRAVAVAGSVWASVAFFLSTFSQNVNTLILTYGVLGGIGFGLMYLPSIVIVGFYFDKKRAFATGVATCGSGIGAFLFAPLCKLLMDTYAWRGAQWIVSAIVLNGIVLGAVYRPLTFKELEKIRRKWRRKRHLLNHSDDDLQESDNPTDTTNIHCQEEYGGGESPVPNDDVTMEEKPLFPTNNSNNNLLTPTIRRRTVSNSVVNEEVMYTSCHSLTWYASSMDARIEEVPMEEMVQPVAPAQNSFQDNIKDALKGLRDAIDFSLLKNTVFLIYGLSCIFCMAGFFVPFIFLPDHAEGLGYSREKGTMLLSVLGITNTIGRVLAGWISDRPWADCLMINNISLIIGGIATILCPFCTTYVLLVLYACVFGMCIAAFVSLRSIILVDLIGLNSLTSAFGIIVLCQGITSFVGAPIAGSLYDATGSYNASYYLAGTTITLAGVMCLPLRRIARWQHKDSKATAAPQGDTASNASSDDKSSEEKVSAV